MVDRDREKPTLAQVVFGICFIIALAALSLSWSLSEAGLGNRIFLWVLAGMLLVLATWRITVAIRLVLERRTD